MNNVSMSAQHDRDTQKNYDELARLNKYDDCATYAASLERPTTGRYVVINGVVEYVR